MNNANTVKSNWWGEFDVAVGESIKRKVGPFELVAERTRSEWRAQITREAQDATELGHHDGLNRFAFSETPSRIKLLPVVADRPVVTRPLNPLSIAPRGEIVLYVSTPIWLRIEVDDPGIILVDTYISRPSDTWFGPNTRIGELCYDSRTAGRTEVSDLSLRPDRAVSAVTIRNETDMLMPLDRISLPTPRLALYADSHGMLWSQDITLVQSEKNDLAQLEISKAAPAAAMHPESVSQPRELVTGHGLFRAFGKIFD